MLKKHSKHLLLIGRRILFSVIILLGLMFASARILLPGITEYRQEIQLLAADILGSPVTINSIEAGWSGLRPVLSLKGVHISQPEHQAGLELQSLEVVLGVLPSLIAGEFMPKAVRIHMRQLEIYREVDGSLGFNLGEIAQDNERDLGSKQLEWILQQPDLQMKVDHFVFEDRGNTLPEISLQQVALDFIKRPASLEARLTTGTSVIADKTSLMVRLEKEKLLQGIYNAEVFLNLKSASLPYWKEIFEDTFILPDTGTTDLNFWMDVRDGTVRQVTGDLLISDLLYRQNHNAGRFSVESIGGQYNWLLTEQGWSLQVGRLHINRQEYRWPDSALLIEYRHEKDNLFLVNADYLRVQDFLPLIDRQPLVHSLMGDQLQRVSPRGDIRDLRLQFSTDEEENQLLDYAMQASIADFSITAYEDWPGAEGLDGYLAATRQGGLLQLTTTNALLDLKTIFRDPLRLETLQGDISWIWLDSGLLIESSRIDAANSHISTQSRLSVHVPDEGAVFLDLQTNFKDGDGAYTSFYLPAVIMGQEAVEWLDKGIVASHVDYGSFIFHGTMEDFPFDKNDGRFEVSFKVRDGVLDYYRDWPVIDQIEAEVSFSGRSMHINASSGRIFGAEIRDTVVQIPDLTLDNPILLIDGMAETPAADMFRYIAETGLSGDYQQALNALRMEGRNDIELSFRLPLSEGEQRLKGKVVFLDNQLNIDDWGLQLNKITGLLNFTEKSFTADNIHASFNDRYVDVVVDTLQLDDGQSHVQIKGKGLADVSRIIESRSPGLAAQLSGEAPFNVLIDIPEESASSLRVSSSLVGTELKFPHPLKKQAAEQLDFVLQTGFSGDSAEKIQFTLGDRMHALLTVNPESHLVNAAYISLGKQDIQQPPDPEELVIGGRLDYLAIDEWNEWFRKNLKAFSRQENNSTFRTFNTDLRFDQLKYYRWLVEDFRVTASSKGDDWSADITGRGAEGQLSYRQSDAGPLLDIDFKHLSILKAADAAPDMQAETEEKSKLLPADLPGANINVENLSYDGRELGELSVTTSSADTRYRIEELILQSEESSLSITGDWKYEADAENRHLTQLLIDIDSDDFGRMLERLGFDDTVKGGDGSLEANFLTESSPLDMNFSVVSGDVHLSILKGEVVEVNPGGTGRIFGLLSLQTLPRRLSLDFSDLFSKGMSFDEIDGGFTISKGHAYTNNLTMDAPSSQVEISGRIGLEDEDYDQHVRVIPNLSSTLPIAGAIAGGPGLAVVMLITHKLLQEPIDKLTEFEYRVTGPWKSPEITKVGSKESTAASENKEPTDSTTGSDSL